jgi:hypothetical protein
MLLGQTAKLSKRPLYDIKFHLLKLIRGASRIKNNDKAQVEAL